MPQKPVKKTAVNKEIFIKILQKRNFNIRRIDSLGPDDYICSDRTLRRSLDDNNMRQQYLNAIAELIDVDPRFLSGEIYSKNPIFRTRSLSLYVSKIDEYPFSRKELDELQKKAIQDHLASIFSLFEISYKQFEVLDFETQYNLQHDLFDSISTILSKYFKVDGYGNKDMPGLDTLLIDLDNYREDHYEYLYGEITLRERFSQSPPQGYTSDQIKSMSANELLDLDQYLQWKDYEPTEEDLAFEMKMNEKYHISD